MGIPQIALGLVGFLLACTASVGSCRESAAAAPALVVLDGSGAVIGPVVAATATATDSLLWVEHEFGGVPIKLLFDESGGVRDTGMRQPLLYESPDCSGTATLDVADDPRAARNAVIFGTEVLWSVGAGRDRTIRAAAWMVRDGNACSATLVGDDLCCAALPSAQVVRTAPATGVPLADLRLNSPFRFEVAR
jgi:hypothetical protein